MTISVLIATCDRAALMKQCLEYLLRGTRLPDEIIVIDQSADSDTESAISGFHRQHRNIVYKRVDWRGKSRSLNHAIDLSHGDFLALTDDDVMVDETWLENFSVLAKENSGVNAFCGQVRAEKNTNVSDYLNLVLTKEVRWVDRKTNPISPSFCGANIFIRRTTLINVGKYNLMFGPGGVFRNNDDGELAYRLVNHGERIMFSPDIYVYHSGWRREADNRRLHFNYTFGLGAFAGHYLRLGDFRPMVFLARKTIFKTARCLISLMTLKNTVFLNEFVSLQGFIMGAWRGMVTRTMESQ